MNFELIFIVIIILVIAGIVIWWLLITTEGAYLGRRVVIYLYDVYARRYDRIKCYVPEWEGRTLAQPILQRVVGVPAPLILDVATGTARMPIAMLDQPAFQGYIVGLDYSRKMLNVAAEKLGSSLGGRVELIYQPADELPFDDNTFDAVTCLEALEFMPDPDKVIAELIRVARPGALILITNRKGLEARLMPGKTQSSIAAGVRLRDHFGLDDVAVNLWQGDYDQVRGFKPGRLIPAPYHAIEAILRCPACHKTELIRVTGGLLCTDCETRIPVAEDGIILYAQAVKNP